MFSNDLIILSTSKKGLQNSLDALSDYTKKWNLEVNMTKTKCMAFSKGYKKEIDSFRYKNQSIEFVKEFKYLGITINKRGSFSPTLTNLSNKATNAIYSLKRKMNTKFISPEIMLKLFDYLVSPILIYGSEIWEPYLNQNFEKWDSNEIEKIHLQFMKSILGVNRSTANVLIRGELGRFSLQKKCIQKNIRYVKYILSKDDNSLVRQAYEYETSKSQSRDTINSRIIELNQLSSRIEENEIDLIKTNSNKIKKHIENIFLKEWQNIFMDSSKSDTYRLFKSRPKLETYLKYVNDIRYIKTLSKFRLSDHKLMIEEGRKRRPIINRCDRLCPNCNKVEDEIHFLIDCSKYNNERKIMYNKIEAFLPNFSEIPDSKSKFILLMTQGNLEVSKILATYIYKGLNTIEK